MEITYHSFIDYKFIMKITSWLYNNIHHNFPKRYNGWINLLKSQFRYCNVSIYDERPSFIKPGYFYSDPHVLMERLIHHRILFNSNGDICIGLFEIAKRKNENDGYQAIKKMKVC